MYTIKRHQHGKEMHSTTIELLVNNGFGGQKHQQTCFRLKVCQVKDEGVKKN